MADSNKNYSQFRTKVLKILLVIGVIPLLIISVVHLVTVVKTRLENVSELQLQVLQGTSQKIRRYLDQKTDVFNLVIELTPVPKNISEVSLSSLNFLIGGLKEEAGDVKEISFIDRDGQEIVKREGGENSTSLVLENVAGREDFQTTIEGVDYFGPINFTSEGPLMRIASQIENREKEAIGIISAEINLELLEEVISKVKVGSQGFVYLIDGEGNLIASSNKNFARPGQNLSQISLIEDTLKNKIHEGKSLEDIYKNSLGDRVIFAAAPVGGIKWFLISEWPWRDAFSVVEMLIRGTLVIIVAALSLIMILSLFMARWVVKPVEILGKGADEISKGNLDYRINIKTGDELEKLGSRFNKMIKVLKENQELRDEFVFIAAHELRTPVTVINWYLEMILNGNFGKVEREMKKALDTVDSSNRRLIKLVQDLLEVARSEAGKMEIKVEPVLIGDNIKEVLKGLERLAAEKKIQLIYQELDKTTKAMADAFKLKEVISNLVDNAIKYAIKPGKITINHEIKDNFLITNIKDEGMGISDDNIKKLFTKFFRVKNRETQDIEGTGLGLFICKEIVERMKGKIWAKSQLGKGNTFSFSLPSA